MGAESFDISIRLPPWRGAACAAWSIVSTGGPFSLAALRLVPFWRGSSEAADQIWGFGLNCFLRDGTENSTIIVLPRNVYDLYIYFSVVRTLHGVCVCVFCPHAPSLERRSHFLQRIHWTFYTFDQRDPQVMMYLSRRWRWWGGFVLNVQSAEARERNPNTGLLRYRLHSTYQNAFLASMEPLEEMQKKTIVKLIFFFHKMHQIKSWNSFRSTQCDQTECQFISDILERNLSCFFVFNLKIRFLMGDPLRRDPDISYIYIYLTTGTSGLTVNQVYITFWESITADVLWSCDL